MPMPIPAMMLRKIAVPAERFSLTIIFPDIDKIKAALIEQIANDNEQDKL